MRWFMLIEEAIIKRLKAWQGISWYVLGYLEDETMFNGKKGLRKGYMGVLVEVQEQPSHASRMSSIQTDPNQASWDRGRVTSSVQGARGAVCLLFPDKDRHQPHSDGGGSTLLELPYPGYSRVSIGWPLSGPIRKAVA